MIESVVGKALEGEVKLSFPAKGVRCVIVDSGNAGRLPRLAPAAEAASCQAHVKARARKLNCRWRLDILASMRPKARASPATRAPNVSRH